MQNVFKQLIKLSLFILKTVKTKCYSPVLPRKNQSMKMKSFHRSVQSNNAFFPGFSHVKFSCFKVGEFLICFFSFFFEKYQFNIFLLIAGSSFFSDLETGFVYRKIVVMFFRYLVSFPLKLTIDHCDSIIGPAAN